MAELSAQTLEELRQQLNATMAVPPAPMAVSAADFCSAYKAAKTTSSNRRYNPLGDSRDAGGRSGDFGAHDNC